MVNLAAYNDEDLKQLYEAVREERCRRATLKHLIDKLDALIAEAKADGFELYNTETSEVITDLVQFN